MVHHFPVINSQVETGLYSLKRMSHYIEKVVNLQRNFASDIAKVTEHETQKSEKIKEDKMQPHVDAYYKIQSVFSMTAMSLLGFSEKVMSDIVEPLNALYKEQEKKRLKLVETEKKYGHTLRETSEQIRSERFECLKQWKVWI